MLLITSPALERYLLDDVTTRRLDAASSAEDESLVCQQWLRQTPAKRCIYEKLYGDLFRLSERRRVLDVGGGLTSLTRQLAHQHDYELVDLLAHDNRAAVDRLAEQVGRNVVFVDDWFNLPPREYDVVIANDLFPNVDQRLGLFLQTLLPRTVNLRLSLTWYSSPRFYMTRRIDADEIFCMQAWDEHQVLRTLDQFSSHIVSFDPAVFHVPHESVFPNGRRVCVVEFEGGLRR